MKFSRQWAMPNADTFSIPPIADFIARHLPHDAESVDPFARNSRLAKYRNDLNPETTAEFHMEAAEFLHQLATGARCTHALMDPPYSPRQISECYKMIGRKVGMVDTQSACLKRNVRNALMTCLTPEATVLSFGWNSVGMGLKRGFEITEILLVCHGGDHNDTLCLAERRLPSLVS